MGDEKIAIRSEVGKLVNANFINELRFQTWVVNSFLVKKSTSKCRICINFRDLSKFWPKYSYLLPRHDQVVDESFSFMDAYSD